jgi:hypothetical protein
MTDEDIERVRRWLSMPEARIGTGGKLEIAALVKAELGSTTPDLGHVVELCACRALREYDYRRVELSDRVCGNVLRIDPYDVGNEQWGYEFWLRGARPTERRRAEVLDKVVSIFLVSPTAANLAGVIGLVLALNKNEGGGMTENKEKVHRWTITGYRDAIEALLGFQRIPDRAKKDE